MHKQFLFSALLLLSACGEAPTSHTTGGEATATVRNDQASSVADATVSPPEPTALGGTGQAGGIAFTVTDVATPNQIGAVGVGPKAEAGETFLVVTYKLKNISGRPLSPSGRPAVTLIDPNGQRYEPDEMASGLAAIHAEDTGGFSADLNPNVSAKDCVAWKLDANAFDRSTWHLVVATDPQLTFALQ